jgi:hypothetical protein
MLRQDLPVRLGPEPWPVQRDFIFLFGAHKSESRGKGRDYIREIFKKKVQPRSDTCSPHARHFSFSRVQMNIYPTCSSDLRVACIIRVLNFHHLPLVNLNLEGLIYSRDKRDTYCLGGGVGLHLHQSKLNLMWGRRCPFDSGPSHSECFLPFAFCRNRGTLPLSLIFFNHSHERKFPHNAYSDLTLLNLI